MSVWNDFFVGILHFWFDGTNYINIGFVANIS